MAQNLVEYILDIKTKAAEQGLDNVVDALEEVEKELKKTQRESTKTESSFDKLKKAGVAVGKVTAVMAAVGVAVLAAGKAAFEASKKVTDLVNELNDLSVRSGVSAKTIQGLRQALLSSGQSAEGLTEILGAISGQFAQLGAEGSAVEKKFQSFGVAVRDTNGDLRSNNDILLDSIRLLQGISDTSERSRASVALFGEAGAKLNQALAAGDFERFLSFTEKFGIDTGPEASRAAAHFQVVLSGLSTVLDGTLQKFVTATDGQNRFIQGMIKLGGVVAFTGSLIESFADEIGYLTDKFLDLLKFGVKQTILILTGPFALALGSIINNLELFGIQVDFVNKAMSSLANFTIETVDPTNRLSNAIDKAKRDMEEYESTMQTLNTSFDGFATGASQASAEMDNLGKSTEETTEKIRTLTDIVNDLLGRFIKFDVARILQDIQTVGIEAEFAFFKLRQTIAQLEGALDPVLTEFADGTGELLIPDEKFFRKITRLMKIALGKVVLKVDDLFATGFFRDLRSRFQNVLKGASEGGLLGAFKALGTGGKVAAIVGGLFAGAIKIAEGLGQRGTTVREIEKSVEQDIRARAKAIELGLQALPRILFNVLPPLFVEFADRVVFGFFKSIAEFVGILKDFFRSIFTREGRQERKEARDRRQEARGEEFRRRLEQLVGIAGFRSGGRYIPSARGGIKFTGSDEGLAMLHRGEFVVPETGQMPQAVQRTMGMGQGGMTININAAVVESNAVDELVRQIERRFQTFGSSTSPLFGGR
jgi:methyl-accepting chemotaxis protein